MANEYIQLDKRLVWRVVFIAFVAAEAILWLRIHRAAPPGLAFIRFIRWSTRLIAFMTLAGSAISFAAALIVRFVVRPLANHWHNPLADDTSREFYLDPKERVLEGAPARRRLGWRWSAGSLVRTDRRLWFFPNAHELEVWSCPLQDLSDVTLEPAPRIAWGLVCDWPERLAIHASGTAGVERFAVADPPAVMSWFSSARPVSVSSPANW